MSLVVSGAYFIYTWTAMRGTVGMKALGMQIGNAGDGKTLTMDQAIRRWIALGAPFRNRPPRRSTLGCLASASSSAWRHLPGSSTCSGRPTAARPSRASDIFAANSMVVKGDPGRGLTLAQPGRAVER